MLIRLIARLAAPMLALLALSAHASPADAGSPYPGWRGFYGQPYTAYKAGINYDDADRRALDGSYRSPAAAPITGEWAGLYVGGHLGASLGSLDITGIGTADASIAEFSGGLHAGYNIQSRHMVAGLEIDATWLGAEGDTTRVGTAALNTTTDWLSSARVRLGFASGDLLYYATAGFALGDQTLIVSDSGSSDTTSQTMVGYVVGGGIEYKLSDNISARVEGLYYGFGDEQIDTWLGSANVDADIVTIRAGLSFQLN